MPCIYPSTSKDTGERYDYMMDQWLHLIENESNWIANAANAASLMALLMEDINWSGFYLYDGKELVLGPFWGKPAETRIPLGKGVCGQSAQARKTIRVEDVHQYPGHIACDISSSSEIVIPMIREDGSLIGVLDIDSPEIGRFEAIDQEYLEKFVALLIKHIDWPRF